MLALILFSVEMEENQKNRFEKIYYKYRNLLFTYAKNIVGNGADAEDVLQNAFIKIAKNIKKVGEIESKETVSFLIVITKNSAYDFLRKQSSYNEIALEDISNIPYDDKAIENLVGKMQYEKIVSCIRNIPSPYMEVLYFHYVNDYSIKHTAHLLNRKTETVKTQLVRGKKILIKELSEVFYE